MFISVGWKSYEYMLLVYLSGAQVDVGSGGSRGSSWFV